MATKNFPPVVVVDENDNEIGTAMLAEVWQKGLYHRIVSVFVVDEHGRMLLQLRGPGVRVYPNCWDQAAGGHVDAGRTYDQTAAQELKEETGIKHVTLELLGTFRSTSNLDDGRIINQFERSYVAKVPAATALKPELAEVSTLRWFTPDELRSRVAAHPETFTSGLLYGLRTYFPSLLGS